MKNVTAVLKKGNLQVNNLPKDLQQRFISLKALYDKFIDTDTQYQQEEEVDKATEKMLDELEDKIATEDEELADDIQDFITEKNKPQPQTEPQKQPEPQKKKEGGLGWLIFGGLALVLTMGAVNTFKKR